MHRRVLLILLIPALAVLVMGALLAQASNERARQASAVADVANLLSKAADLDTALGAETISASGMLGAGDVFERTDEALAAFAAVADTAPQHVEPALGIVQRTLALRPDLDTGIISPLQIGDRYGTARRVVREAVTAAARDLENADSARDLTPLLALLQAGSAHVDERLGVELALRYQTWAPGQLGSVVGAIERQEVHLEVARLGGFPVEVHSLLEGVRSVLRTTNELPETLDEGQWNSISSSWAEALEGEVGARAAQVASQAAAAADDADRNRSITVAISVGTLLLGIGFALAVSLREVGRVKQLADAAATFARRPDELIRIDDDGTDVVGRLARTFETMSDRLRADGRRQRLESSALQSIANQRPLAATLGFCNQLVEGVGRFERFEGGVGFVTGSTVYPLDDPALIESADTRIAVGLLRTAHQRSADLADLELRANHDQLTGVLNRGTVLERLDEFCRDAQRDRPGVLYVDVDDFKAVNDEHGHTSGDRLLSAVAQMLDRVAKDAGGITGRLGGDEFVVVIPDARDEAHLETLGKRVVQTLARIKTPRTMRLRVSVGCALMRPGVSSHQLLAEADAAMYVAKDGDTSAVIVSNEELRAAAAEVDQRDRRIRLLVTRADIEIVYQPIWTSDGARMVGLEALSRPGETYPISPAELWSHAARLGIARQLDLIVLERVCRDQVTMRAGGGEVPTVGVNLSAQSVASPRFVEDICAVLERTKCDPKWLVFEVTEDHLVDDVAATAARLERLREMGSWIAIDDFGTGYSSLAYLAGLPVDLLKIDRSFVTHIDSNPTNRAIVATVLGLANALGLHVVGEGVEREAERATLEGLGAGFMQGFALGKPLSFSALQHYIKEQQLEVVR